MSSYKELMVFISIYFGCHIHRYNTYHGSLNCVSFRFTVGRIDTVHINQI